MHRAERVLVVAVLLLALGACGADDDPALDTAGSGEADTNGATGGGSEEQGDEAGAVLGTGTLILPTGELRFDVDTCHEDDKLEHPELRVHVEGEGTGADGAFTVQVVRTRSDAHEIDVIRVRYDDEPLGSSYEAQRVHDTSTGEVSDQWGDETTPLLELERGDDAVTVVARDAVFGHYPGNGGDAEVVGKGELDVTCRRST